MYGENMRVVKTLKHVGSLKKNVDQAKASVTREEELSIIKHTQENEKKDLAN